jgi:hypothetical protein
MATWMALPRGASGNYLPNLRNLTLNYTPAPVLRLPAGRRPAKEPNLLIVFSSSSSSAVLAQCLRSIETLASTVQIL